MPALSPDEVDAVFNSFGDKAKGNGADKPVELVPINLAQYDTEEIPAREWGVENRFPRRTVGLLSGHGGAGKSLLLLQLSAAHVLQKDWLRSLPEPGPVLLVNCEDDEGELVRRLQPILAHYRASYSDVAADLHVFSLVERDDATGQLLATVGRDGIVRPTPLYDALLAKAGEVKPICIVIDNVADVFGGNEIDRSQVRQFVRLMRRLAIAADGYVIMSAHPSLQGISSKSGLSGSTQWHNSVRARAYLRGPSDKENDGEAPAPDARVLEFMKSNYSALAEQVTLKWTNGLYLPAPTPSAPETAAANNAADTLFLELLDQHTRLGDNVSPKSRSNNYAPTVFAKTREAKAAGIGKDVFAAALARLIEAGRVCLEPYGPPSDDTKRLARLHASSTHAPRTLSTAPPYTPPPCVEGSHACSGGMGDGVESRVVGPAPGATCVCCNSADGEVMKVRSAVPGSKTEPLHADCAEGWFSRHPS